ncbi:dUTPase [Bacillus sp. OTU530]|jgi:dimeric dUTPase (all-alpha-NTP-PPase superfamily)|uniref:dUTPase n=1 Tax=Bacillus sp. OTU530 TaxID=3043862 RepID=UPI00313E857E
MDKLETIFALQKKLDDKIIEERQIDKNVADWVLGITVAMDSEIEEIRQLLPWKWWKNEKEIDMEELRKEVIDLWHFLPSLSMKVGLTAEDVYNMYMEKNQENHDRQDGKSSKEGYAVKATESALK